MQIKGGEENIYSLGLLYDTYYFINYYIFKYNLLNSPNK